MRCQRQSLLTLGLSLLLESSTAAAAGFSPSAFHPVAEPAGSALALFPNGKAGLWTASFKLGFNHAVYQSTGTGMNVGLDFGRAVHPSSHLYIIAPIVFTFSYTNTVTDSNSTQSRSTRIQLPIGLQYDIPFFAPGLSLTPRLSIGYTFIHREVLVIPDGTAILRSHLGVLTPALGVKWTWRGRLHLGADLLNLPIFFNSSSVWVIYSVLFYGGFNFGAPRPRAESARGLDAPAY